MSRSAGSDLLSPGVLAEAVTWRRDLHRHPELGYHEQRTGDFIAAQLSAWGLRVHRGLAGTGVVGTLTRGTSRRSVGIRADMDALPMQEHSGVLHASHTTGVMHGCGHDGHVAMALAAARVCVALPSLDGTVRFIFQPAEEIEGGARRMVEEGLFRLFPCDSVYALHNWPALPLGTCVARDGPALAAVGTFEITVTGRGCHGALPHEGTDALLAGCELVTALPSIASRDIDPRQTAILSATQIQAGDTWNIIPDRCLIRGTTRWFDDDVGAVLERRIKELSYAIAAAFRCSAEVHYQRRGPATLNNPRAAGFVREVAAAPPLKLEVVDTPPSTGAEDFAFMLKVKRGAYVFIGNGDGTHRV